MEGAEAVRQDFALAEHPTTSLGLGGWELGEMATSKRTAGGHEVAKQKEDSWTPTPTQACGQGPTPKGRNGLCLLAPFMSFDRLPCRDPMSFFFL
jgi:hypothetical protein